MSRNYFRVVIPQNADQLLALTDRILQKHHQDATNSLLPPALAEQLESKGRIARNEQNRSHALNRQKEKCNEARDLILGIHANQDSYTAGTVLYFVTASRDILLGQYRGNERILGDWGFVVNSPKGAVQVIVSKQVDRLIALAKKVMQKHYEDGERSPLHKLDWNELQNRLYEAEKQLEEGRKYSRDKVTATQSRNIALGIEKGQNSKTSGTVLHLIKSIRDLLLGNFRGREQELGGWGFEVNTNKAATRRRYDHVTTKL